MIHSPKLGDDKEFMLKWSSFGGVDTPDSLLVSGVALFFSIYSLSFSGLSSLRFI
jgi:hypothetical protein